MDIVFDDGQPVIIRDDGGLAPGSTITLVGTHSVVDIRGLRGTVEQPIVITGNGVLLPPIAGEYNFRDNQHVHFDFSSDGLEYGLECRACWHVWDRVGSEEASFGIAISGIFFNLPATAQTIALQFSPRAQHVISDIVICDNLITNPGRAGMYVGTPHYFDHPGQHEMRDVRIYNNTLIDVGEGIDVKGCVSGCEIHHNYIEQVNTASRAAMEAGIKLGNGTVGDVHHNIVINSQGNGIHLVTRMPDEKRTHHNTLVNCGHADPVYQDAIRINDDNVLLHTNLIYQAQRHGINITSQAVNVTTRDNVVLGCGDAPVKYGDRLQELPSNHLAGVVENVALARALDIPITEIPTPVAKIFKIEFEPMVARVIET